MTEPTQDDDNTSRPDTDETQQQTEEKQCRICLDGVDAEAELGRLIRPCLCKGSISHVHVKCLQTWRATSTVAGGVDARFFYCPQCKYHYRFARTKAFQLAENPVIVGGISAILFTALVLLSSFITTYFSGAFQEPSYDYGYYFISPTSVARDVVRAALRIIQDETGIPLTEEDNNKFPPEKLMQYPKPSPRLGFISNFLRRFIVGLPLVGAGSLLQMFFSMPFLGPLQWLARYRGSRRRENSRDIAGLLIMVVVVVGSLRALFKVYEWTQRITKRLLLRAEDAILEVG